MELFRDRYQKIVAENAGKKAYRDPASDKEYTYQEFDIYVRKLAAGLAAKGLQKGDAAAIMLPHSIDYIATMYACLLSGLSYIPLSDTWPQDRIQTIVDDAGATVVLREDFLEGIDQLSPITDFPEMKGEDTAVVIYTSGSTGKPKGVIHNHIGLIKAIMRYGVYMDFREGDIFGSNTPFYFIAAMQDVFSAFFRGITTVLIPDELRGDPMRLADFIDQENIASAFITPKVLLFFQKKGTSLRRVLAGSERLSQLFFDDFTLVNGYGMSESGGGVLAFVVDHEYENTPIGSPIGDEKIHVLDENGKEADEGELCVAGDVAVGYRNLPELTAETFVKNPFEKEDGYPVLLRTGDLVKRLPSGDILYISRKDWMIKINGQRVEPGEIEIALKSLDGIKDACVKDFSRPDGQIYITAYYVTEDGQELEEESIKEQLSKRLLSYMIPSYYIHLDSLPVNANGKLDRKALPIPDLSGHANAFEAEDAANREKTVLEQVLYEICCKAIGNGNFGVYTPLAYAGLTSVSTMELMAALNKKYGFSPTAQDFLRGFRILDIENALISNWLNQGSNPDTLSGNGTVKLTEAPLSQTQLGIYLECMMDETSDKYNLPLLLKVSKEADADRLAHAIKVAVDAHPSMKCSIEPDESGSARMITHPDLAWEVVIEESDLSDAELEEKLTNEPVCFKLSEAPLFRFRIIKNKDATYLSMVFHHILMDGTSIAVLMEDIESAYQNEDVTAETYDLLQLAVDEKELRESGVLSKAKEVYDRILNGVSLSSLPDPEKSVQEAEGKAGSFEWELSGIDPAELNEFCKKNNLTENAFFTAAFAYMLAKLSGNDEALFASIYNGRTKAETLRITGMLVKTYPIYVSIDNTKNIKDFITDVQKLIQELTGNDIYSFAEAVRDYDVNADILFAYQGDNFTDFTVAGELAKEIPQQFEDAMEALSVDVWKKGGSYQIAIDYQVDLFSSKQIQWICDLYGMIVSGLLKEEFLKDINLLSDEAKKFLKEVNDTDVTTEFRPVSSMFEEWAEKTPDHLAVITPFTKTTYRELNESANRIAHALFDGGARNHVVSLMLPRSEHVYMVRQGILKAGGAFLSIAPDYPDERVKVMVEDSESVILVVNEEVLAERKEFLDTFSCKVVTVESLLEDERTENLKLTAAEDDLAYTIFTSGSTGKPKGVMLTQGNLFNFLDANPKNPEILGYVERATVSLSLAAITFDVSIMEEFIPLTHGMTVCIATDEEIHNPIALSKLMLDNDVDMVTCTPSFLSNCIGLPVMKDALKNVKSYDFGAEAFPASLYDKIVAINPDAYIMNGYGPTEATISCTMDQVTDPALITIGKPASNVRAYVFDERGNSLPPLVPGELIIGGKGVGKGYCGRPDLTEKVYFTYEGEPAYKTGDVVAWTSDGRIRFHGRADDQVKLRGLRVELGEIESAINAVEGVITSIVIMTGEEDNKFLAGYFTADHEIAPDDLKAEISKTLTPYMVPGVLMQLPAMPLTQNGKIDKKKLPKVEYVPAAAEYIAPENEVERDFCDWFAEVLNLEKVSVEGNFFELGGTSLSASVIVIKASDKGYNIVYADVFKAQTPRLLAALVNDDVIPEEEETEPEIKEIRSFDYSKLPLDFNTEDNLQEIQRGSVGNLLLTGATGFLGIHVLHEYLAMESGNVYCLLRGEAPEKRLKQLYFYYFDEDLNPYLEDRVTVINGDITDPASLEKVKEYPFDTLINCAALVKHFVNDDSLERINVQGVKNLIALCKENGKRLIQTSTVSVAGEGIDGNPPRDFRIKENVLYRGQLLDNAYILTKFKAEKAMLEAISEGLDGKIMRLGNLMGRHSDGEFQVNYGSNAFIRSLVSYKVIGAIPYSILNAVTDFSEIDMTAKAILLLAGTPKEFTVFHPVNNHVVTFADIVYSMRLYGFTVDCVEDSEFAVRMKEAGDASSALTAYNQREGAERRYIIDQNCDFTTNALYRLEFKWPVSGEKYIVKMIKALDELIMFEE